MRPSSAPGAGVANYRLTPRARDDLTHLWQQGAERWGPERADRYLDGLIDTFALIAEFPQIARLRHEISPPVRLHPHGSHVIVYLDDPEVVVLRILHDRQDLLAALDS